jgi:hypothetical protein
MTNDRRRTVYIPPGEQEKARPEDYTFMFDSELPYKKLGVRRAKTKASQLKYYKIHGTKKRI